MSIYIGGRKVIKIYKDLDEIASVYKGLDKVFGRGSPPPPPPTGKVKLQYLQSDGTAYIDTGLRGAYSSSLSTVVTMYFEPVDSKPIAFFGDVSTTSKGLSLAIDFSNTRDDIGSRYGDQIQYIRNSAFNPAVHPNRVFKCVISRTSIEIWHSGGTDYGLFRWSGTPSQFTTASSMYLFALRTASGTSSYKGKMRIHECEITSANGGHLHLYPYTIDNVPCMYDPDQDLAFYNIGSGAFTPGPEDQSSALLSVLTGTNQNGSHDEILLNELLGYDAYT